MKELMKGLDLDDPQTLRKVFNDERVECTLNTFKLGTDHKQTKVTVNLAAEFEFYKLLILKVTSTKPLWKMNT